MKKRKNELRIFTELAPHGEGQWYHHLPQGHWGALGEICNGILQIKPTGFIGVRSPGLGCSEYNRTDCLDYFMLYIDPVYPGLFYKQFCN